MEHTGNANGARLVLHVLQQLGHNVQAATPIGAGLVGHQDPETPLDRV